MVEVEIIVKGQITEHWSEWFDNLTLSYLPADRMALIGQVEDQSALHGLLSRLWDLGLPLISVWTGAPKTPGTVTQTNVRAIIERETPQGREVVLQIRDQPHQGGKWLELPGGPIEPFEPLVEALRRSVRAETGLELTCIEGSSSYIQSGAADTSVECLAPFAVYHTLCGPVASLGIYFRCQARGEPLHSEDTTQCIRWMPVGQVAQWLKQDRESGTRRFSWVDLAGLLFYLNDLKTPT
jgi:8-oxo-dGTP diphosphatase